MDAKGILTRRAKTLKEALFMSSPFPKLKRRDSPIRYISRHTIFGMSQRMYFTIESVRAYPSLSSTGDCIRGNMSNYNEIGE